VFVTRIVYRTVSPTAGEASSTLAVTARSAETGAAVTVNGALVAPVSPGALAVSVYPAPGWEIRRFAKVATPATAVAVVVPESVPPPGLAPSAIVTVPVNVGTVPPPLSTARTVTGGEIGDPTCVVPGC